MQRNIERALKALILLTLLVFNVFKGNFVNIAVVPWFFRNYGIIHGCVALTLITFTLALIQLKFYDKLKKSFMHNEEAIQNILGGTPKTFSQGLAWLLSRFINRIVLFVIMVTVLDPFLATAFFRDLKIFKCSQTWIFIASLVTGTATTMYLILLVWGVNRNQ